MADFAGGPGALVHISRGLMDRSRAAIERTRDRTERVKRLIPRSLERIVWTRELVGEHRAAREAVAAFVSIAKSYGLSAPVTLALLKDIVQTAQKHAGDTQSGGALEQAVMRWGTAACGH